MRTLSNDEMKIISGAGNYSDKFGPGGRKNNSSNNKGNPRYSDPGVADCNRAIVVGGVLGALGGGMVGAGLGVAGAALGGDCVKSASSTNNNSGNRNSNNSIGGQCRW